MKVEDIKGKNFCISGLVGEEEMMLKSIIENQGGFVRSSAVKDLDYLIYHPQFGVDTKKYRTTKEMIEAGSKAQMLELSSFLKGILGRE